MERLHTSRQKQAAASKNKLVAAAMELFNEKGYEQTTVQDICKRAGLSVGVFYHYFPSKSDVLQTLRLRKNEELLDYISTKSCSRKHTEAILELFGFVVRQQSDGPFDLVRNSFATAVHQGFQLDEDLLNLCAQVIESAQMAGELTDKLSTETICRDLLTASRGFVYHWCECGGAFDLETEHKSYLRRLLQAYI